jgi:type II secretory pathway pseudopilin PulG
LPFADANRATLFVAGCFVVLAILAGVVLTAVHVDKAEVNNTVKVIIGFAALIVSNALISMQAASRAEEKAEQVRQTLLATDRARTQKLAQIEDVAVQTQVTARSTHSLVNGLRSQTLRQVAQLARRLADATGSPEDLAEAERADAELREHAAREAADAVEQSKNLLQDRPQA